MSGAPILFIITGLKRGGAETSLYELLRGLDRTHLSPTVFSLTGDGPVGELIRSLGIPVHAFELRGIIRFVPQLIKIVRAARALSPTIVQSWMYHANLVTIVLALFLRKSRILWSIRHFNLSLANNRFLTVLTAHLCAFFSSRIPQKIVYVSHRAREVHELIGYDPTRGMVIHNGFDTDRFAPNLERRDATRRSLGLTDENLLVGIFGRYDIQKDHHNFIVAASLCVKEFPSALFIMVGENLTEANGTIVAWRDSFGLTRHLRLLGARKDIPELMNALDLHVLSSKGEAFPRVLGEAMASGVPSVVTDVGDCHLIVGDTGKVVIPENSVALGEEMIAMLRMPQRERAALGVRARERICGEFSLQKMRQAFTRLFSGVSQDV